MQDIDKSEALMLQLGMLPGPRKRGNLAAHLHRVSETVDADGHRFIVVQGFHESTDMQLIVNAARQVGFTTSAGLNGALKFSEISGSSDVAMIPSLTTVDHMRRAVETQPKTITQHDKSSTCSSSVVVFCFLVLLLILYITYVTGYITETSTAAGFERVMNWSTRPPA